MVQLIHVVGTVLINNGWCTLYCLLMLYVLTLLDHINFEFNSCPCNCQASSRHVSLILDYFQLPVLPSMQVTMGVIQGLDLFNNLLMQLLNLQDMRTIT